MASMKLVSGKQIASDLAKQVNRQVLFSAETEKIVAKIIGDVRKNGDRALRKYAQKFDALDRKQSFAVSDREMSDALGSVSPEFRHAIEAAAKNIRRFAEWQKPS